GWEHSLEKRISAVYGKIIRLDAGGGLTAYFDDSDQDLTYRAFMPAWETSWIVKAPSGWTRYFRQGGTETYDAAGWLTAQTDRTGNVTAFNRSGSELLLSIVVPGGRTLTFTYSGSR